MFRLPARAWLALPLGIATALVLEDVLVCWIAGAPPKAWGLVSLSPMRLGSFLAAACVLIAATWTCAAGVPRHWRGRLALFALIVLGLFLGNGRYIGSNDVAATRLVPFALGREGRLCFERSPNIPVDPNALPYWFVPAGDHIVSRYPVATGVLALPVYVPALAGSYDPNRERVHELERIAAAALALITVLIVAAIARLWLADGAAIAVASVYAFGTNVATVLSKALWQHTGGAFGFALALAGLLLARNARSQWLLVGFGLGIAVAARTTNVAPAALVWIASAVALGPRALLLSAAVAALPVAAHLGYSQFYFGSITGNGYGREAIEGWTGQGWLGLLVSPGRGLLLYSPCLAFAAAALYRGDRAQIERRVSLLLLAAVAALLLVMGRWWCWWGGGSPGERMTSDVTPILGVGLALAHTQFANARPSWRCAWLVSCAYACAVHTLIAFARPGGFVTEQFFRVMSGPWAWHAYAPVTYVLGFFDR
jgi:hypothetical protein